MKRIEKAYTNLSNLEGQLILLLNQYENENPSVMPESVYRALNSYLNIKSHEEEKLSEGLDVDPVDTIYDYRINKDISL